MAGFALWRRLRSALGGPEDAARVAFESREEGLVAKRATDGLARLSRSIRLRSFVEEIGEVRKALEYRGEAGDLVVAQARMGSHARQGPVLRPRHEARPHRVERHIANSRGQMPLVQRHGAEAPLPEMSRE